MRVAHVAVVLFSMFIGALVNGQDVNLVGLRRHLIDANAPYIAFDEVDDRYDWIEVAFALPSAPSDLTFVFTPEGVSQQDFIDQIQTLQAKGKQVLLSIGGTNVDLASEVDQLHFINSANDLIDLYGFDGKDVDIEHESTILVTSETIASPSNESHVRLIEAIQQTMANHRSTHREKLLLTLAPETAYVQGGPSVFGSIWGGYADAGTVEAAENGERAEFRVEGS